MARRPDPAAPTASGRLRRKIELVNGPLAVACAALFRHPRLRELWPLYAIRTYWIIRATVPLMEEAAARARDCGDDPVAAGVASFLADHIEKERGHDEWVLEDLELIGVARADVLARMPSPTVAGLVGSQYYRVRHCHPVALLGYIAVMEGSPPSAELIDRLAAGSRYPREAFRAFALHGQLDLEHRADLYEAIDALRLTPAHERLLGVTAISAIDLLARSVEEVIEEAA